MKIDKFIERFSRQIILNNIGVKGQIKLFNSRVAIIGCGATGTAVAELLARAGIGFIRVVDRDFVELSNLHRTHLFTEKDVLDNMPKALSCKQHLNEISKFVDVEYIIENVSSDNIRDIIKDVDLVIDGTDNLETRFLINEASIELKKPWIMIGVERWYGMTKFINVERGACLKCFIHRNDRRHENVCETIGVTNVAVSLTTSIAASLALKYLLGLDVEDDLFIIDAYNITVERIKVNKNPNCSVCVRREFNLLNRKIVDRARILCGVNVVEVLPEKAIKIDITRIEKCSIFNKVKIFDKFAYMMIKDVEIILLSNGKALIRGTTDTNFAENLYNQIFNELIKLNAIQNTNYKE
jgi:molybdopterin/thiamine biosynthesis adenylyltransferase